MNAQVLLKYQGKTVENMKFFSSVGTRHPNFGHDAWVGTECLAVQCGRFILDMS